MRNAIILVSIFSILVTPIFGKEGGHISITAKVELYNPPGDADFAPMFTIEARYRLSAFIAIVGNGSWTSYDDDGADITYIPVAVDGELHPLGRGVFDPFTGAGLSANFKQYDYEIAEDETDLTIGAELFGGATYKPQNNFGFELDIKYRIEDLANAGDSGSWSIGGGVTGSWEKDL